MAGRSHAKGIPLSPVIYTITMEEWKPCQMCPFQRLSFGVAVVTQADLLIFVFGLCMVTHAVVGVRLV